MKKVKKKMSKEGRRGKGLTFLLMVVSLVATVLLLGTVAAVQGAEVKEVKRYAPVSPAPGAEFEVTLRITGELPLVVGIVETIPEGFSFVSTTLPSGEYSVSGQKIAFAAINETEIKYTVKAPSSGEGTFTGTWIDMLSENEGSIADTIVMVGGGGAGAIEEEVTPTPMPTPAVPTVTKATRSIPKMEAGKEVAMVFEDMDVSMIALKADKNVSNVELKVERVERTPDIPAPPGIAYTYLDIGMEHVAGTKIEGKVEFKVAKSWIADNNIDETTVTLYKYDGREGWKKLPTSKVGEDENFVYFEAETPKFSIFAVTGERKAEGAAATPTPTSTPAVIVTPTPAAPTITPSPTPTSKVPGFEAILAAVALMIVYTRVYRKKKRGGDVK